MLSVETREREGDLMVREYPRMKVNMGYVNLTGQRKYNVSVMHQLQYKMKDI